MWIIVSIILGSIIGYMMYLLWFPTREASFDNDLCMACHTTTEPRGLKDCPSGAPYGTYCYDFQACAKRAEGKRNLIW